MTTDPARPAGLACEPGATPEEVAAIVAVLAAARDDARTAPDEEPRMPAWRRAARREATGAVR
jgi:hypothetical protein